MRLELAVAIAALVAGLAAAGPVHAADRGCASTHARASAHQPARQAARGPVEIVYGAPRAYAPPPPPAPPPAPAAAFAPPPGYFGAPADYGAPGFYDYADYYGVPVVYGYASGWNRRYLRSGYHYSRARPAHRPGAVGVAHPRGAYRRR
jgi:hypothetical protein